MRASIYDVRTEGEEGVKMRNTQYLRTNNYSVRGSSRTANNVGGMGKTSNPRIWRDGVYFVLVEGDEVKKVVNVIYGGPIFRMAVRLGPCSERAHPTLPHRHKAKNSSSHLFSLRRPPRSD